MNTDKNKAPSLAKVIAQAFTFLIITLGIVALSAGYIWLGFQLYTIMAGFVIPNATRASEGLAVVIVVVMIAAPVAGGFVMDVLNRSKRRNERVIENVRILTVGSKKGL